MATLNQWIAGARPRTLPAAVAPVLVGTALAGWHDQPAWVPAGLALVVALALQVGVNYANDYSDGIRGTDDNRVGPFRLTGSQAAPPGQVKAAAFGALAVAAVAGLGLAAMSSWWLVALGAACLLAAWFYTGGRRPYGYLGLGELMVFVFFGLVAVVGTGYVQLGSAPATLWIAGAGVGALACAILVANNLRDIPTDLLAGKRTLAVRLGDRRTRWWYVSLVALAAVCVVGVAALTTWLELLGLGFLLAVVRPVRAVLGGAKGPELIPVLAQTGMAEVAWATLVAISLSLT